MKQYLINIPEQRKKDIHFLHTFIQKSSVKFKPYFAYNMLGYGKFAYINYKKEKLDWPVIALANHKNYMSIYVCALEDGVYIAEKYKANLGKVRVGKSCIRFKRLEDLNLPTLKKVLKHAANNPGLN